MFLQGDREDRGMSFPTAHVEESWQMAEFYNNKEFKSRYVEWSKALKELYVPSLRDYVKKNYPFGPVWGPAGSAAAPKAPAPTLTTPPPPPSPPHTLQLHLQLRIYLQEKSNKIHISVKRNVETWPYLTPDLLDINAIN
ncbi:cyclase-associated protein 1-like protein [Carex littledalei]|uniref:Cyclase-associated protein 1-like protein n=1 Tax=Carex littledalei TaxID=544730 RepID=A0A833QHR7_9POAL|nr:cyclase-associated protein 1-like protein [Carex littledalei]